MSAEFYAESIDENSLSRAIKSFIEDSSEYPDLPSFISEIHAGYDSVLELRDDLSRECNVAKFIAQSPHGEFNDDAQAVFNGQLVGMQVLNYAYPEAGLVHNVAHPYLQRHINDLGVHDSTTYAQLAGWMRQSLLAAESDSTVPNTHDAFISKISHELYSNQEHRELLSVGFRLVIGERLKLQSPKKQAPEFIKSTKGLFDWYNQDHWENIDYTKNTILDTYNKYVRAFEGMQFEDKGMGIGIKRLIESRINTYNRDGSLIEREEPLKINGNLFALHDKNGQKFTDHFDENHDIVGFFDGFSMVIAPYNAEVTQATQGKKPVYEHTQLTPAVRIKEPVVIRYSTDEAIEFTKNAPDTFEIPLIYDGLAMSRLNVPELQQ